MNVLYSGFIDPNHSAFGGYHNIIYYPNCKKVLLMQNYFLGKLPSKYKLRRIPARLLDLDTRRQRHKYDITHLFYGEMTMIPYIPYRKDPQHKTVITLHVDVEEHWCYKYFIKNLKSFDGIIVLSTQQQEYYKNKHGIETTFIPHGFNTPVFKFKLPKDIKGNIIDTNHINLITSGKNYRDFETLSKVIDRFKDNSRFIFHLVGTPADIKTQLTSYPNVKIYPRINNDEYYSLIKSCDYGFLPVTFATANNALLETQAIGIKSILPRIPGILDYAAKENIFYNDYENLINIIDHLPKSSISDEILSHAQKFRWENIYHQLDKFYSDLLSL